MEVSFLRISLTYSQCYWLIRISKTIQCTFTAQAQCHRRFMDWIRSPSLHIPGVWLWNNIRRGYLPMKFGINLRPQSTNTLTAKQNINWVYMYMYCFKFVLSKLNKPMRKSKTSLETYIPEKGLNILHPKRRN